MLQNRQMPHNIEAEQSVIGSMFITRAAIEKVLEVLTSEDFYLEQHQKLFDVIVSLVTESIPIDITTVTNQLNNQNLLNAVGGIEYLSRLSNSVPTVANIEHYIKIVEEKALLRRLINEASGVVNDAFASGGTLENILDESEKKILSVVRNRRSTEFKTLREVLSKTEHDLDELRKRKHQITGLQTGFEAYDQMTSGLQNKELMILAARPAMGKSALAINICLNAAKNSNASVALFSLEMGAEQLALRMIQSEGMVEGFKLRNGQFNASDSKKIAHAISGLSELNIYMDDTPGLSINELKSKCRRIASKEQGLDLIVIDYLQLISVNSSHGNRQQEVSEISRSLKTLALELDLPIIALSQLSRAVESREDKRPLMSDLRESGSIEQDADMVMMLFREDYYKKDDDDPNKASDVELIIGKNRSGPTGAVKLKFQKNYSLFTDVDENRKFDG